jgi:hypothetical protein
MLWIEDLSEWSRRIFTVRSRYQGNGWWRHSRLEKGLVDAVVICELWRLAVALSVLVLTSRVRVFNKFNLWSKPRLQSLPNTTCTSKSKYSYIFNHSVWAFLVIEDEQHFEPKLLCLYNFTQLTDTRANVPSSCRRTLQELWPLDHRDGLYTSPHTWKGDKNSTSTL